MKPPFRADQVGSLLRPKELAQARQDYKQGKLDAKTLKALEDRCIEKAIRRQESLGLQAVTDGEMRRDWWHLDFMTQLDGVTAVANPGPKFGGTEEQPPIPSVTGKVGCSKPIMVDDFAYLKKNTKQTAKFTIPSPAMLHLRGGRSSISTTAYPDLAEFWSDTAAAYRKAIRHLADAGCTYLQLDDVSFSYLCDPKIQETARRNGDDPAQAAAHLRRRGIRRAQGPARGHDRDHAHLPRQLQEQLGRLGRLRDGGRGDVLLGRGRLLHGIRLRARRRLRAAALPAEGQEGRFGFDHFEISRA